MQPNKLIFWLVTCHILLLNNSSLKIWYFVVYNKIFYSQIKIFFVTYVSAKTMTLFCSHCTLSFLLLTQFSVILVELLEHIASSLQNTPNSQTITEMRLICFNKIPACNTKSVCLLLLSIIEQFKELILPGTVYNSIALLYDNCCSLLKVLVANILESRSNIFVLCLTSFQY